MKTNCLKTAWTLCALFGLSASAFATEYQVDPAHSRVSFSIRHMMSKVTGEFKDYQGTFKFDEAKKTFSDANIQIKATSISTGIEKRDGHLRSPDFFDVAKFPTLTATTGTVKSVGGNKYAWNTDLTIHGVTKPVVFELEFLGAAKDPWGKSMAGFHAKTKINRKDFGLQWNKAIEAGGFMVGDDVEITLDVEANPTK